MLDTCVTPISHELYAWGTAQNSLMFAGFALVGLLSVCTTRAAQRFAGRGGPAAMRLYPRRLLCTGLLVLGAAHVFALATLTPARFPVAALLSQTQTQTQTQTLTLTLTLTLALALALTLTRSGVPSRRSRSVGRGGRAPRSRRGDIAEM